MKKEKDYLITKADKDMSDLLIVVQGVPYTYQIQTKNVQELLKHALRIREYERGIELTSEDRAVANEIWGKDRVLNNADYISAHSCKLGGYMAEYTSMGWHILHKASKVK